MVKAKLNSRHDQFKSVARISVKRRCQNEMKYSLNILFVLSCLSLHWSKSLTATSNSAPVKATNAAVTMPKQCRPGKTSPESLAFRWKPGAVINIYYLKNSFDAEELKAFSRAIDNWNRSLKEIDSHILFVEAGERESVVRDNASVTVMRGIPRGAERVGEIKFYWMSNGAARLTIIVSPRVTSLSALTSLMTHELGHSLGLADCYQCRRGTTAMSAFKDYNKDNDVYEPSACDKYVVARGHL
jgi:hypothetical protein